MKPSHTPVVGDRVLEKYLGWQHPATVIAITPPETMYLVGRSPVTLPARYKIEFDEPRPLSCMTFDEHRLVLIDDVNDENWLPDNFEYDEERT